MPYRLDTHVLTVDANVIHKVDTENPANLYSMWTGEFDKNTHATASPQWLTNQFNAVFSRCAESLEQGHRLENLSWRLWQRTQLVENDKRLASISATSSSSTLPKTVPSEARLHDIPQLSGSVDSLADDENIDIASASVPLDIVRPRIRRLESTRSNRHISSDDFGKMVVSIVKDKTPLSAPSYASLSLAPRKVAVQPELSLERSNSSSTDSQTSEESHSSINMPIKAIQEFVPTQAPAPKIFPQPAPAISTDDSIPEPRSSPAHKPVQLKKQTPRFALGGSCSSSELGQSVEIRKPIMSKKSAFRMGVSSEEDASLRSNLGKSASLSVPKKKTSFSNNLTTRTFEAESAVDSDTEGEYVDESAIDDDDDSSDWEDSIEDSGKSSVDDKFFQRVESKANLASRPSLITLMLAQNERAMTLSNQASQSTSAIPRSRLGHGNPTLGGSPNDSDEGPLMMKGMRHSNLKPIIEVPRSSAQPIVATTNHVHAQAALSPRTTRRNMLATELTESLRRHLLWERQQKSSTANAVLKRRHTSHDVANLKQYPDKPCMKQSEDVNASSWNQYFSKEAFNGYHSKGW